MGGGLVESVPIFNQIKMTIDGGDPGVWEDRGGEVEGQDDFNEAQFRSVLGVLFVNTGRSSNSLELMDALASRLSGELCRYGAEADEVINAFIQEVASLAQRYSFPCLQAVGGDEHEAFVFANECVRISLGMVSNKFGEYKAMMSGISAKVRESTEKVDGLGRIMEIQAGMIRDVREVLRREGATAADLSQLRKKFELGFAQAEALLDKIDPKKVSAFAAGLGDGGWEG